MVEYLVYAFVAYLLWCIFSGLRSFIRHMRHQDSQTQEGADQPLIGSGPYDSSTGRKAAEPDSHWQAVYVPSVGGSDGGCGGGHG